MFVNSALKEKGLHHAIKHCSGCENHSPKLDKKLSSSPTQEEVISSQALYIDNLQQQIYFLENEIRYLQAHMEQANRVQPNVFSEAEKMVKKLMELQKEVQTLKVELKRKQTVIDLHRSEKERLSKKKEESDSAFFKQKTAYLGELVELRKERDQYFEKLLELQKVIEENEQRETHLLGDNDNLQVQVDELNNEISRDKALIEELQESKKDIQKQLYEANLRLEMKSITDHQETVSCLKTEVQELHCHLAEANRVVEQEKLLKIKLAEENDSYIKRHAVLEAEFAQCKAKLQEELSIRSSLEEIHLKTVLELSEVKSAVSRLECEISPLKQQLKSEKEKNLVLIMQVADEKRFKEREEQRSQHLEKVIEQKDEKVKSREAENTLFLRDNAALRDEVQLLKEQLKSRDSEVEQLKQKVMEMQMSVEEFIQSSEAATRLEKHRWKQLTQLAQGIQTLSKEAVVDKDNKEIV